MGLQDELRSDEGSRARAQRNAPSLAQGGMALADILAGALRGSVAGTLGLPGDIEHLGRNVIRALREGKLAEVASDDDSGNLLPTTKNVSARLPSVVPAGADDEKSRSHTAEVAQKFGENVTQEGAVIKAARPALELAGKGVSRVAENIRTMPDSPVTGGPLSQVGAVGGRKPPKPPEAPEQAPTGFEPPPSNPLSDLLRQPLLGRHETTTPGRVINRTNKGGGYSVHLPSGELPTEGLMMGKYANTDPRNLVTDNLTRGQLADIVRKNEKALSRDDAHLGTWRDPETGKVYVDVSRRFPSDEIRQATKFGERTGQIGGYNVGTQETFPVNRWDGSGGFIEGEEFQRRMREMEREGADYLATRPASQWWDMKGGPFERVYGAQNLPQVAGFTASTAPNNLLRNNMQQMSEYLRRHIKGEPILQPDWVAPEGLMTWKPGSSIGMEDARKANLEKSGRGELHLLQQNKVREEAAAMMGDPNAAPLDRYWARIAEDPPSGVYTSSAEGVVPPGKPYEALKRAVATGAEEAGKPLRNYSANVWTGIRERIRKHGELYGVKFRKGAAGESKSYEDHFTDLISEKAKHMGITTEELERRMSAGDANLLGWAAATPLLGPLFAGGGSGEAQAAEMPAALRNRQPAPQ